MTWHVLEVDDGLVCVVPLDDLVDHRYDNGCARGPRAELAPNAGGPEGGSSCTTPSTDGSRASVYVPSARRCGWRRS